VNVRAYWPRRIHMLLWLSPSATIHTDSRYSARLLIHLVYKTGTAVLCKYKLLQDFFDKLSLVSRTCSFPLHSSVPLYFAQESLLFTVYHNIS
jgi:hypothetical protein